MMENLMCFAVGLVAIVLVVCAWRGYFMSAFALKVAQYVARKCSFEDVKKGHWFDVFFIHVGLVLALSISTWLSYNIGCEITKQWRKAYPPKDEYSVVQNYAHPNSHESSASGYIYKGSHHFPIAKCNRSISEHHTTIELTNNDYLTIRCEKNGKWTVVE